MNTIFLGIVIFLIVLAVFDLVVGVSNDAVNFLNSAIGAKVATFKTIVIIASIGIFTGASLSNGMMDVARHGIMTPEYFSFYNVMCVFLAVMVTDVVLLDIFNSLGMPTSTTVSMVFELFGGAFAIALLKIHEGAVGDNGILLSLGDLLNTEKAISVILGIFLSVAIAFILGTLVQWIARMVFTFTYRVNGRTTDYTGNMGNRLVSSLKIGIFGGISITSILWFLLINGLKSSSFMTNEVKEFINQNSVLIIGSGVLVFSLVMTFLSAFKLPILKFVVLFGTFALAMAFAGNDLVNFVGVPLSGLEAYMDFTDNSTVDANSFMMKSLMKSAQTPVIFLILAGIIMVLSLVFSKKAQNVVKTSVDLSRQDEGDEMFGSSSLARTLVRTSTRISQSIASLIPQKMSNWIDSRFNIDASILKKGAAFDEIRAAINLVLAGILVAVGTSHKLPLSTTYVTFMVAMGTSLADRAWNRESAVFRITGVLSVIGGWFITAGAAFVLCFIITLIMNFGGFIAMVLAIALAIYLLFRSHVASKSTSKSKSDEIFIQIINSNDKVQCWNLLNQHVNIIVQENLNFIGNNYDSMTKSFLYEDYRHLKKTTSLFDEQRKDLKRQRRKEIVGLRKLESIVSIEKGTWYFLIINSLSQMIYCLKRMGGPCLEHLGNNFRPIPQNYLNDYIDYQNEVVRIFNRSLSKENSEELRFDAHKLQNQLSNFRKVIIDDIHTKSLNIESMTILLNLVQESQELLSGLRHLLRGLNKFSE